VPRQLIVTRAASADLSRMEAWLTQPGAAWPGWFWQLTGF